MSFQTYIEGLRAKPEHVRKRYAFWTSFGVTFLIFAFWVSSFGSSLGGESKATIAETVEKVASPGQSLIAGAGYFFTDIKDLVFGPKKVIYSSVEVRPGKL